MRRVLGPFGDMVTFVELSIAIVNVKGVLPLQIHVFLKTNCFAIIDRVSQHS
jgi:hypothetical protein